MKALLLFVGNVGFGSYAVACRTRTDFINVIVSLFVCFYLSSVKEQQPFQKFFLFSTVILFLPLAMTSAAKSLLRPAMYFCRFPLMASIRKSCRVFSMMLISDTRKPSPSCRVQRWWAGSASWFPYERRYQTGKMPSMRSFQYSSI